MSETIKCETCKNIDVIPPMKNNRNEIILCSITGDKPTIRQIYGENKDCKHYERENYETTITKNID